MKETKKATSPSPAGTDVPQSSAPVAYDWSQETTTGFESTRPEDLGIPFLTILQKGSPEVDETNKDYATKKIDGAKPGDIINTLTREILHHRGGDPVAIIPCSHERLYVEWTPREKGGGMVKNHQNILVLNECSKNDRGQDVLKNGNIIMTTSYFKVLLLGGDKPTQAVIGMSSTQLRQARMWLNLMMAIKVSTPKGRITPPMFSHRYHLSTLVETNEKGSWYSWKIEGGGMVQDMAMIEAARGASQRQLAAPQTSTTEAEKF